MRAVRLHETGGPQCLRVDDVPVPQPKPGEIRIKVSHAALNHRDVYITQGKYPGIELPKTLGSDCCGIVDALGAGAAGPQAGTRVVVNPMLHWGGDARAWSKDATLLGMPRDGTFAEFVCVPAENVYCAPQALSDEEAAALPLAGLTAMRAVTTRGELTKEDTLLLTGIGGGVQTFALLIAKQIGARVVVTSSSDEKLARAKELGADETINYKTNPEWYKAAKKIGIDIAIDSAGGETFARLLDVVKDGGRVVTYGGTQGNATIRPFSLFWRHLDVRGTSMGSPADFEALLAACERGLRPVVDRVCAMDEAPAAAQRLDEAGQFGKIVLRISS